MNKFKIIETPDYVLAVSDEEIKEGDWCLLDNNIGMSTGYQILQCLKANVEDGEYDFEDKGESFYTGRCKKIIAYQPKGNAPELDLPLLPEIIEDDVENQKWYKDAISVLKDEHSIKMAKMCLKAGYKAATKVYSEEDLRKAWELGAAYGTAEDDILPESIEAQKEFIQSLKQSKTPKWFVAEMEYDLESIDSSKKVMKLKTTTINSKTYLVGHYE